MTINAAVLVEAVRQTLGQHSGPSDNSRLLRAIGDEPELAQFQDRFHFQVSSWARATHSGLAYWLLQRAQSADPETAVAGLLRYVTNETIAGTHVMALGGVQVDRVVVLSETMRLVPFAEIGQLTWASAILGMYESFHENYRPRAALTERVEFRKAIREPDSPMDFPPNIYLALEDARRCMTAVGPSCPVWLGNWTELDSWVPTYGAAAAIPNPFETGGFPRELSMADWEILSGLHKAWRNLSDGERKHLRVPLDRLNRALRNVPPVDTAIELGVAIDALFLAEREADRGEQTLTLRLRASRFLGTTVADRKRLARLFGALYRARSMAVHAGRLDDRIDGFDTRSLLADGGRLTSVALQRIIAEGEPDWTELLFS